MVCVAQCSRFEAIEQYVVVAVGRSHHYQAGSRPAEQRSLESGQPGGVEVLDHLNERGRVECTPSPVPVGETAQPYRNPLR